MTSKVSFSNKNVAGELRRKAWVIALCALNFIFYSPILTMLRYTSIKQVMTLQTIVSEMERGFICDIQNIISVGMAAVLLGISCFSFLLSKKKTDLYHSLPVRRGWLFLTMYATGLIIFFSTYALAEIIRVIASAANGFYTFNAFSYHMSTVIMDIIFFLMMYNVTIVAVMLTGNIVVCICSVFVLNFIYPIAVSCFEWLGDIYFATRTSSFLSESSYLSRVSYLSPLYTYANYISKACEEGYDYNGFAIMRSNIEIILISIVVAAVLFVAALFLYKKRSSEAAGKALAFKVSEPVIRIPLVVISALFFACGFETITNVERSVGIWISLAVGGVLMHCVLEIIFNFEFKALFHHSIQMAACVGAAAVIIASYWFDLFNYDEYLPDREQIKEAAVYTNAIDTDLTYKWIDDADENGLCDLEQTGGHIRMFNNRFSDGPMIDAIYELAKISVAHLDDGDFDTTIEDTQISDMFYIDESTKDSQCIRVDVAWRLKNGRDVCRSYLVRSDIVKEYINDIYRRTEYKKAAYDLYDANDLGVIKTLDVYDNAGKIALGLEKRKDIDAFMAAYISDMNNADIDATSALPIASLEPIVGVRDESRMWGDLNGYYIYPGFTNTLAFMEGMDADMSWMTTAVDWERVESIVVNSNGYIRRKESVDSEYEEDIYDNNIYITKQYTNTDEHGRMMIELLCQSIQIDNNRKASDFYNDFEVGPSFEVYYQAEDGIQRSIRACIRREDIPKELIDDLLYMAMNGE